MIHQMDLGSKFHSLKMVVLGVGLTLLVMSGLWLKSHNRAIINAVMYPEVVEALEVQKDFVVKK